MCCVPDAIATKMETLLRKSFFFLALLILNLVVIGIECKTNNNNNQKDKDSSTDICSKNPCYNGGKCSQTNATPGFKCVCSGTGYYGTRCQSKCPSGLPNDRKRTPTPSECVII